MKAEHDIHDDWLTWLKKEHIPEILASKCFQNAKLLLLHDVDDADGPTYALQLFAESKADYNRYISLHAIDIARKEQEKWNTKMYTFSTLMQSIQDTFE